MLVAGHFAFAAPAASAHSVGESGGPAVVIANEASLADTAAAISLAASDPRATVVLAEGADSLGDQAAASIARRRPARAVLVGGEAVLSRALQREIAGLAPGAVIERIAGSSRIVTAALVERQGRDRDAARSLVIVHGWTDRDVALGAALVASGGADAVLLTGAGRLSDTVAESIADHPPGRILLLGSVAAPHSPVGQALDSLGAMPIERYENSEPGEIIASSSGGSLPLELRHGVLVDADNPGGVMSGAVVAANDPGAVVLLARRDVPSTASYKLRDGWSPERITVVGQAISTIPGFGLPGSSAATGESSTEQAFETFSVGSSFACGLLASSEIECWGSNSDGTATPPNGNFAAVSAGSHHACAVRTDGRLACWGRDTYRRASPPGGKFSAVSPGWQHSCAVRTDGRLTCWGNSRNRATAAPGGIFTALDAGGGHTCALRTDGQVKCWGENAGGEASAPGGKYKAVAIGSSHSCAIRTDGRLVCWGQNVKGQSRPPAGRFTALALGQNFGCAVRDDAAVECWGNNDDGESQPPEGSFTDVSAGRRHMCGHRPDGTVTCWGYRSQPKVAASILP